MFRRILLYLFGISMGVLVLKVTVFKDRDMTEWYPSKRLKRDMQESAKVIRPLADCQLKCLSIPHSEIDRSIVHGEIDFKHSGKHERPRWYVIQHQTLAGTQVEMKYIHPTDTLLLVLDRLLLGDSIACDCPE